MSKLLIIQSREKDLGGFSVRRLLPHASRRMVGPFIFLDHMGPAEFKPGDGINVRPHPHIHLATVTYLFAGKIHHRDSLGNDQFIEPGAINWMTAGHGIVHSERTSADLKKTGYKLNGLQCWVALPEKFEEAPPSFVHHPANSLPEFETEGVELKLLLGTAFGHESPVKVHSDIFYVDVKIKKGQSLRLPADGREIAIYVVHGGLDISGQALDAFTMAVGMGDEKCILTAKQDSRCMLLGGAPLGKRFIDWNFVSSSAANIEVAKKEWRQGPGASGSRFPKIPGDDQEFIPLPDEPAKH